MVAGGPWMPLQLSDFFPLSFHDIDCDVLSQHPAYDWPKVGAKLC